MPRKNLIQIIKGNVTHAELLGDILEGLVVQAIVDNKENAHIVTIEQIIEALFNGPHQCLLIQVGNIC